MIERDLTCYTNLAVAIAVGSGTYLSSSAKHAARLGERVDTIVGRNWREWAPRTELALFEKRFAGALAGTPSDCVGVAIRSDGRIATSRLALLPMTAASGEPAVLGVHTAIRVSGAGYASPAEADGGFDIARWMADLADELAHVAAQAGLIRLSRSLGVVARHEGGEGAPDWKAPLGRG